MRTAIVSDLHLGNAFGEDIARDAEIRRVLLDEIGEADRVVLLGDAIELREEPLAPSLQRARPFLEELGEVLAGRLVVLVPGNHDHRLAEPLLEALALRGQPLGLDHRAGSAGDAGRLIDGWLGGAELEIAYPGLWLRDDVYATHGHYMDCHMTLPRIECIAAAASMRVFGAIPEHARPADYERVLRPIYGLSFGLAQGDQARRATRPSERAWRAISSSRNGAGGRARRAAIRVAAGAGIPAAVWSINRLLGAGFDHDLSAASISRSGIDAGAEMALRLGLSAVHVVTGHTHRGGPRDEEAAWELAGGGQLHNTGSWVFADAFHHPGKPPGPYWPGTVTWVEEKGAPRRIHLLANRPHRDLEEIVRESAALQATGR